MRLLFVGFAHCSSYAGPGVDERWHAGEQRDVPADVASYLLTTFGGAFVPCEAEHAAPQPEPTVGAMGAPPADRMIRSPRKRGA